MRRVEPPVDTTKNCIQSAKDKVLERAKNLPILGYIDWVLEEIAEISCLDYFKGVLLISMLIILLDRMKRVI